MSERVSFLTVMMGRVPRTFEPTRWTNPTLTPRPRSLDMFGPNKYLGRSTDLSGPLRPGTGRKTKLFTAGWRHHYGSPGFIIHTHVASGCPNGVRALVGSQFVFFLLHRPPFVISKRKGPIGPFTIYLGQYKWSRHDTWQYCDAHINISKYETIP